jgi:outer membrane protein assembly factor BamB
LLDNQEIVVGFSDGAVLRLDSSNGSVLERVYNGKGRYPDIIAQPIVVQGGVVVSGFEQPIWKQNVEDILWQEDFGSVQGGLIALDEANNTMIYHPGADGVLRKIDTTSGAVEWSWDSEKGTALTSPQRVLNHLLVASHSGGLFMIDSESGNEVWRTRADFQHTGILQSPAMEDCALTVLTRTGFLERYVTCSKQLSDSTSTSSNSDWNQNILP